jgi:hypothetical protein
MRYFENGFEEVFDTHLEAIRGRLRAIMRREALSRPKPNIFVTIDRRYRVVGAAIVRSPWVWQMKMNGVGREVLLGVPVLPLRPVHRKGKRARR